MTIEPRKLATYLQVAKAQRERAAKQMIATYGADSKGAAEVQGDIAELSQAITDCLKQAAASPKTK